MFSMCVNGSMCLLLLSMYDIESPFHGFSQVALLCCDKEILFHNHGNLILTVPIDISGENSLMSQVLLMELYLVGSISWYLLMNREI